jgi:hypothetical protein
MTATFYKYAFIVGMVSAIIFSGWTLHKTAVMSAVKDAEVRVEQEFRESMDEQRKRLTAKADAAEDSLKVAIAKNYQRKTDEVKAIQSRTGSVATGVRDAITTGNTSGGSIASDPRKNSGTSTSFDLRLSGFDGEILTKWFAGSAAELQAELRACESDFAVVRKTLNDFREKNK